MASFWLSKHAPNNIKKVELFFPVTGHSYLPPDRVFGLTEKVIRKKEVIYQPREYIDIIQEHAKVVKVGEDCQIYDWKTEKDVYFKKPAQFHFQLGSCRRIVLSKTVQKNVFFRGEYTYKSDLGVAQPLTKMGKKILNMNPPIILASNSVKNAKKVDVDNLLKKHYGMQWRENEELNFYKRIIDFYEVPNDREEEEMITCEPLDEVNHINV